MGVDTTTNDTYLRMVSARLLMVITESLRVSPKPVGGAIEAREGKVWERLG